MTWTQLSLQAPSTVGQVARNANATTLDVFGRLVAKRFELEAEAVGILGTVGNASFNSDPTQAVGPESIRQGAAAVRGKAKIGESGRFKLGAELGIATPGGGPGMGVNPGRSCNFSVTPVTCAQTPGTFDGQQYAGTAGSSGSLDNYRFNPAYYVDLILWRELIGTVTNAWYAKPTFRWDVLDGLYVWSQVVYSQALNAYATPSEVNRPLGVEFDLGMKYQSDDGFVFFLDYGLLKGLSGLNVTAATGGTPSVFNPSGIAQNLHAGLGIVY